MIYLLAAKEWIVHKIVFNYKKHSFSRTQRFNTTIPTSTTGHNPRTVPSSSHPTPLWSIL